jgi:hypothetical protein
MSYGFDLIHIPSGVDPLMFYKQKLPEREAEVLESLRSADDLLLDRPNKENEQHLVNALLAVLPSLKRGQFRNNTELTERQKRIQIALFDESAGVSVSFVGGAEETRDVLQNVWNCLRVLQSEAGLSVYDAQVGKILNLDSDFEIVFKTYGWRKRTGSIKGDVKRKNLCR